MEKMGVLFALQIPLDADINLFRLIYNAFFFGVFFMLNDYSFLTYIVGFLGLVVLAIGVVIVFKGRDFLNRYLDKIRILTILFLLLLISNYFLNYMNK